MNEVTALLNNPAFWVFLGTFTTAYFGYKGIITKYPKIIKRQKLPTSFDELRAVVEVLQGELVKKDKRHKEDTDYLLQQVRELRDDNRELSIKLAKSLTENADCKAQITKLTKRLQHHENRLNNAHIPRNGNNDDPDNGV